MSINHFSYIRTTESNGAEENTNDTISTCYGKCNISPKSLAGKPVANYIKDLVKSKISTLKKIPTLVIVNVGNDPASAIYTKGKEKDCIECGINCIIDSHINDATFDEVKTSLINYSNDDKVDGIILQLPLPDTFTEEEMYKLINCINPIKDVDCFTDINIGKLNSGQPYLAPCTPAGIMALLDFYNIDISGKTCAIINRSNLVGKPLAAMMTSKDCTVTLCHSKTPHLEEIIKRSDIVVTAVGKENFLNSDMINESAIVIDVSINRNSNGIVCGDSDISVYHKAKNITPVPGGIGLTTRAMLMMNTVIAMEKRQYK